MITQHFCREVIPFFKQQKFVLFFENVRKYLKRELSNGNSLLDLYDSVQCLNQELLTLNDTHWKNYDATESSTTKRF